MTLIRVACVVALAALALVFGSEARAGEVGAISVTVYRTSIDTELGDTFTFRSTITNHHSTPASGLIAHLNVLSLRAGTYVDPEDWSASRTRYLAPIPPGGSTTITWKMQAVNSGSFGVYVAVLAGDRAAGPPTTGPTISLTVAKRTTLNSGGILPLALGIPAFLCLVWLGLRISRARSRAADGAGQAPSAAGSSSP